jgi:predicted dehydrogenase
VYRDELVEFQIDGTHGSAVAGLNKCVAQQRAHTPKPVWNPDLPVTESFRSQWQEVPANAELDNGFKLQWEEFLRDVVAGREHRFGLLSAARGVQLAELGLQSSAERRTIDIPEISL